MSSRKKLLAKMSKRVEWGKHSLMKTFSNLTTRPVMLAALIYILAQNSAYTLEDALADLLEPMLYSEED